LSEGDKAANLITHWLRAYNQGKTELRVCLDTVRGLLPHTPLAKDVREIKPPQEFSNASFAGALVRDPHDAGVWGIFYKPFSPERNRFTVAHELGHLVLHRAQQSNFQCNSKMIRGVEGMKQIEREADDFASTLLMRNDVIRQELDHSKLSLAQVSSLAKACDVSLEALCIRLVRLTQFRMVLVHWDQGFMKYQWASRTACLSKLRLHEISGPLEYPVGSLAADFSTEQEWQGQPVPVQVWFPHEPAHMRLTEFKHTFRAKNRVLSLLVLESAEPLRFKPDAI
jgi:IrrE N-terminal-like domain